MSAPDSNATRIDTEGQARQKMHWAPKLIALVFGILLLALAILLSISSHGVPQGVLSLLLPNPGQQRLHTASPGVIPHDQNTLYESHMKKIAEQASLGWKLELGGLDSLQSDVPGNVTVKVQDAQGRPVVLEHVEVALSRMANSSDDRHLALKPQGDGVYSGEIVISDPGRWLIGVTVTRGPDTYTTQRSLFINEPAKK